MQKETATEINTLRGLACLLLVSFHVIGAKPDVGLQISQGFVREFSDMLSYIRMPLFTFLSGLVYAYRPFESDSIGFVRKKGRRLILPMLTVGTLFALTQYFTPGSNAPIDNWYMLHIDPVAHYWFIESLFIIFLTIVLLEKIKMFESLTKFIFIFVCSGVLYISHIDIPYFSISGFIYLMPYFLLGMGMHRFCDFRSRRLGVTLAVCVLSVFCLIYVDVIPLYDKNTLFALTVGCIGCLSLLLLRPKLKIFAWIGTFSYGIYLFHVFFTAGSRMVLYKIDLSSTLLIFLLSFIIGIGGGIVTEKILSMNITFKWLLLGASRRA